jgi:hypothetical protein
MTCGQQIGRYRELRRQTLVRTVAATRVARWFIFRPKIPILGKFWRALEWKMLIHMFYAHL